MADTDFDSEAQFQRVMGSFLNEMITTHGFCFEEAYVVVHGEIKREYDQRVRARRATFKVIEGEPSALCKKQ